MLIQESGSVFIGFADARKCAHCHNTTIWQVRGRYLKQSIVGMPVTDQITSIYLHCPICEHKEAIIVNTHAFYKYFIPDEKWEKVYAILDAGKSYTKRWFDQCDDAKQKKELLKRLTKLKAYNMVKHLEDFSASARP